MKFAIAISIAFLGAIVAAGCTLGHPAETDGGVDPVYAVEARLIEAQRLPANKSAAGKKDFMVELQLRNIGSEEIEYNSFVMEIGSLVATVVDPNGNKVPSLPPPVPPEDLDRFFKPLPVGAQATFRYNVGGMFGVDLNGRYRIKIEADYRVPYEVVDGKVSRYTSRTVTSNWLQFCASKTQLRRC